MDLLDLFKYYEKIEHFSEGDVIFEEGKAGDRMYVILLGEVDIRVKGHLIYKAVAGDIIGEMALIDSRSRSATAVAGGNCRMVSVGEKQFLGMIKETPEFALHVMRVLAARLRYMDQKV